MKDFDYASWFRKKRNEKGLRLTDISDKTGITDVSLSRYETGKRIPGLKAAMDIAEAMGIESISIHDFDGSYDTTDEESEQEILPCPYCGSKGVLRERKRTEEEKEKGTGEGYWVECFDSYGCGAEIGFFSKKEDAIAAWNRRG